MNEICLCGMEEMFAKVEIKQFTGKKKVLSMGCQQMMKDEKSKGLLCTVTTCMSATWGVEKKRMASSCLIYGLRRKSLLKWAVYFCRFHWQESERTFLWYKAVGGGICFCLEESHFKGNHLLLNHFGESPKQGRVPEKHSELTHRHLNHIWIDGCFLSASLPAFLCLCL